MAIDVQCPDCRKRYRVKDALAGRKIKCKQCSATMNVPDPMLGDDEWGDYDDEPDLPPPRAGASKSKSSSKKKKGASIASGTASVGKKLFAVLGMIFGVVIIIGSVIAVFNGTPRASEGSSLGAS